MTHRIYFLETRISAVDYCKTSIILYSLSTLTMC